MCVGGGGGGVTCSVSAESLRLKVIDKERKKQQKTKERGERGGWGLTRSNTVTKMDLHCSLAAKEKLGRQPGPS